MPLDAEQAALLVRVTARISAGLLAANLLVSARRITDGRGAYRTADARLFVALIISHTIHFVCVGLLALATNGANLESRLGYTAVFAVGILFYIGCAAILRVKVRDGDRWTTRRQRNTEVWLLVALWGGFAQAYVGRIRQSPLFAALAIALVYSIAVFLSRALRSEPIQSWQTSGR
jgi:predicted small integral membrane protein